MYKAQSKNKSRDWRKKSLTLNHDSLGECHKWIRYGQEHALEARKCLPEGR